MGEKGKGEKMKKKQLRRVFPFLKVLEKLSAQDQIILVDFLNDEGCRAIFECVTNALYNTKLDNRKKLKQDLTSNKTHLRYLTNNKKSMRVKRKKLKQVGGSIGLILGTVLPLLASFLSK